MSETPSSPLIDIASVFARILATEQPEPEPEPEPVPDPRTQVLRARLLGFLASPGRGRPRRGLPLVRHFLNPRQGRPGDPLEVRTEARDLVTILRIIAPTLPGGAALESDLAIMLADLYGRHMLPDDLAAIGASAWAAGT